MKTKFSGILTLLLAFVVQFAFAQNTVSGTVTDESGLPLPGATILIQGTSTGTSTDFDGNYSINASSGQVLVFSYLGYANQIATVGSSNRIDIQMQPDNELDEVVVVAYGTSTLRTNVASVSTLKADKIENRANPAVLQTLQGQIAGVNIGADTGQPGADSTVYIRGVGSINSESEPLYIIDGVATNRDNFRAINPNDIETVSVLKDASGTSLYGNRGSNGVIVITTKRGKFDEALSFQYSTSFGFNDLQSYNNVQLMNSSQILNWQRDNNGGDGAGLTNAEIAALSRQSNTDWYDVFFRQGTTMSHNVSMTSGSDKTNNFTSLQYFEQDGTLFNTDFKRMSVRNNFTGRSLNEKFNYNLNLNLVYSKTNEQDGTGSNSTFFNPFRASALGLPYLSPYNADGSITVNGPVTPGVPGTFTGTNIKNFVYVLLNSMLLNKDEEEEVRIVSNFNADWEFIDNFTAGISFGVDYRSERRTEILHPESILGPFQSRQSNQAAFGGIYEETDTRDARTTTLTSLTYANTINDKHDVELSAFMEFNRDFIDIIDFDQEGLDPRFLGSTGAFISSNTQELINGNLVNPYRPELNSISANTQTFSLFSRGSYVYDGKYGIQASIRRDRTFRFRDDNEWGTFWSVAGRWNIDQEDFMADSVFSLLKLRASYGTVGNQLVGSNVVNSNIGTTFALPTNYRGLNVSLSEIISGTGYNSTVSLIPNANNLGNPNLKWETTKSTNIGVDFGIWNNKLTGELDVYKRTTEDLFFSRNVSLINQGNTIDSNIGSMENKGVEMKLDYVILNNNDLNIYIGAIGSYNQNEVTELAPETGGQIIDGSLTPLAVGQPFGSFYLTRYAGINPANGEALFLDANGNLADQRTVADDVFVGKSTIPEWQGGFNTGITYKGFGLTTQWTWAGDHYRVNLDYASLEDTGVGTVGNGQNRSLTVLNAWQNPGDITDIPAVNSQNSAFTLAVFTDKYLENSAFLRLRNIELSYTLPSKFLNRTPFTNIKFFGQGENLLTFTKYRGRDPEGGFRSIDRGEYPTARIYTFGAVINF